MAFRQGRGEGASPQRAVSEPQRRRKAIYGSTLRAAAAFARVRRCSSVTDPLRICFLLAPCTRAKSAAANVQLFLRQDTSPSLLVRQLVGLVPWRACEFLESQARCVCYSLAMAPKLSGKKLAVLGAGKLGGILLRAYLKQRLFEPSRVTATVRHAERAAVLSKELGIAVTTDNREAVKDADVILLTVKPQAVAEVLQQIAAEIGPEALLVSVAASVPTGFIEKQLAATSGDNHDNVAVVRAMPNTPAAVGCGMTTICGGPHASPDHLEIARSMFDAVGRTIVLDEKHMDAVTGLSASGPAFAYIILESFAEAGVKVGLPRDVATLLAAQTMKGAASVVLETGDHPALLKDAVTTPAGCTIDGILELEEGKLRVTLIKAVVKATSRAGELLFEK